MTNGQKLSGQLWDYMVKQHWLKQSEGRFGKAEFEIERFGEPIQNHVCSNRKAIGLLLLLNPKRCSHQVGD
jgi:hypothetical protein